MRRKKESEKTSSVKSGRWFIKITSLILSLLVVFFMIPVVSYAEMIETAEELLSAKPEEAEEKISLSYTSEDPAYELVEMREERAKYFRMEDGTYVVASYEYPVHTMQDGEWVDVDNSLTDNGNEIFTSNARIKFAKKITGNGSLFTLHESNHKLTLSLIGAVKKTEGKIIASESEGEKEEKKTLGKLINLENITSRVIYEDILEGVDIEYVLESTNLKENIIVKEKSEDGYSYSFELSLNNLTARMTPEGDVQIVNERGVVVYTIPAPVVYDSNGEYADPSSAQQSLEYMGNGKCRLTVSVSEDWMNAEERVYPVTVDPTLSVAESSVIDLYVDRNNSYGYYHNSPYLWISETEDSYWKIKDDFLPNLPTSAHITEAVIEFSVCGIGDIGAYEVLTNWQQYLCYDSTLDVNGDCVYIAGQGKISNNILDYAAIVVPEGCEEMERFEWDITEAAKQWFSGYNYGVAFKLLPESSGYSFFKSTEDADPYMAYEYKPTFIMKYVDTKGIEDYYSYSSQSAGLAGSGSINLATGNLTFAINTLTSSDYLMPVSPTLVYDGSVAGSSYVYGGKSKIAFSSQSGLAYGFKLNLCETVVKESYVDIAGVEKDVYIYSDGDGTEHYFYQALDENGAPITNTYHDDSGLRLSLVDSTSGFTIKSIDGTVKRFTKRSGNISGTSGVWYLTKITDRVGNAVEITLNSSYLPQSTRLIPNGSTAIETFKFIYNSSGKLAVIRNVATGEAVVLKNSDIYNASSYSSGTKYLRKIIYAHGAKTLTDTQWLNYANGSTVSGITADASASYEYNKDGRLTKARDDLSQRYIVYTYPYSSGTVTTVTEYGSSGTQGQTVKYTYKYGYTEVTTSGADDRISTTADNIITRYTFDRSARVISSYSTNYDRSEIYGAVSGTYEDQDNIKNNIKESAAMGGSSVNYLLNGSFEDDNFAYWARSGRVTLKTQDEDASGIYEAELALGVTDQVSLTQGVRLQAGKYTLSLSYKSYNCKNSAAALVGIKKRSSANYVVYKYLSLEDTVPGAKLSSSLEFVIEEETNAIYDVVILFNGNATDYSTLCVDDVVLTTGIGVGVYNHVKYGSFDNSYVDMSGNTLSYSNFWSGASGIYNVQDMKRCAGLISTGVWNTKTMVQTVYTAPSETIYAYDHESSDITFYSNANRSFTLSGFGYSNSIMNNKTAKFGIGIKVYYYQGEGETDVVKEYFYDFEGSENQWQYVIGTFSLQLASASSDDWDKYKCVRKIDIICEYSGQLKNSIGYFDNISLVDSEHTSYTQYLYDEKGNLVTERSGRDVIYHKYDEYNNPILLADDICNYVMYEYDENGEKLLSISSYYYTLKNTIQWWRKYLSWDEFYEHIDQITPKTYTTYQYNSYGQCIKTTTGEAQFSDSSQSAALEFANNAKKLTSEYVYHTDSTSSPDGTYKLVFGAIKDETDTNGITTRYYYNWQNGKLEAVINLGTENGIAYFYDSIGRLIKAAPAYCLSDTEYFTDYLNLGKVNYIYDSQGNLSAISTDSTTYNFVYDSFGNVTGISTGQDLLVKYTYNSQNGKLNEVTYANGWLYDCTEDCTDDCDHRYSERYVYDSLDNIKEIWYTVNEVESKAYEYEYTQNGQLYSVTNCKTGDVKVYKYDETGRIVGYGEYNTDDNRNDYTTEITYDNKSRVYQQTVYASYNIGNATVDDLSVKTYFYNTDGSLDYVATRGNSNITEYLEYDNLDRLSGIRNSGGGFNNEITLTYKENGSLTSDRIGTYSSKIGTGASATTTTYSYEYDTNGNIVSVTYSDGKKITYEYDTLNQLTRENNQPLGKTYTYIYDTAGNILQKKTYNYTTVATRNLGSPIDTIDYLYGNGDWGDQLTNYDGHSITYDEIGNPLSYYNGSSYTFTWEGRRLATAETISKYIVFTYNEDGVRIGKTVNGVDHTYLVDGTTILSEQWGDHLIVYVYDVNGAPLGMRYRSSSYTANTWDIYWFEKNLQGDIVAVYDNNGTKLVSYSYDAWGNFTTQYVNNGQFTSAAYNPFRYRGYFYDIDLNLYYLNSRYYDSTVGRFINADGAISDVGGDIRGYNMYSYCFNNPVNMTDPDGNWPQWATKLVAAVAVVAVVAAIAAVTVATAGAGTAVACVAVGAAKGAAIGLATGAVTGAAAGAVNHRLSTGSWEGADEAALNGMADGALSGAITGAITGGMNSNVCFVAGTAVLSSIGFVAIETIRVGDKVWAENPETGQKELKEVVQTFVNETEHLVHVFVKGEEIITTPEHPFYSPVKGWTAACELRAGDILVSVNGEYVIVEKIQHEILETPITVYNFEVADFHTYYVGKDSILVHNVCGTQKALPKNGIKVDSSDALDLADDFLGKGYSEMSPGRFVSSDGLRQVRMTSSDLTPINNHAGAPHLNFERLVPNPLKPGKFQIIENSHVYIFD